MGGDGACGMSQYDRQFGGWLPEDEFPRRATTAELALIKKRAFNYVPHGDSMSISDDSKFNRYSREPVFYMAHPVASDPKFDYEQNVTHIIEMMRFFFRKARVRVSAPYHTMLLALEDTDDAERREGLETDLCIVRCMNRLILVGHKISSGMQDELYAASEAGATIWNFVGLTRGEILRTSEVRQHQVDRSYREKRYELDGPSTGTFDTIRKTV